MRKRIFRKFCVFVVATTLALSTVNPAHATPAQFDLLHGSGRAGLSFSIAQDNPCPASNDSDYFAWASFTDALGNVFSDFQLAGVGSGGNWEWTMPVQLPVSVSLGAGTVNVWCAHAIEGHTERTLDYQPQPYVVTTEAATLSLNSTSFSVGGQLHAASSVPCPNLTGWSIGAYHQNRNVNVGSIPLTVRDWDYSTGYWDINWTIPTQVETPHGAMIDTPGGVYAFSFACGIGDRWMLYDPMNITINAPTVSYVALGDSFSSGEGVEPFEASTARPGINTCHRSEKAYPRLLEQDPGTLFGLGGQFVACSGATTDALTLVYNGQGPQLGKVTSETDLVTMTIGGNNMPFSAFAKACVIGQFGCEGNAQDEAMQGIVNNVIPQMESALGAVRDRLAYLYNSKATVLVLGYPQMIPENPWITPNSDCWWLNSEGEISAIRDVTNALNTAIKNEVEAIGGKFKFVPADAPESPFAGHELCRDPLVSQPYFINYIPVMPVEYVFHPNQAGQQTYADLIKMYLSQHPLN